LHMGNFKHWFCENSICVCVCVCCIMFHLIRTNNFLVQVQIWTRGRTSNGREKSKYAHSKQKKLIQCHFIIKNSISGEAFYTPERNEQDSFICRPCLYTTNFEKSFIELIPSNLLLYLSFDYNVTRGNSSYNYCQLKEFQ